MIPGWLRPVLAALAGLGLLLAAGIAVQTVRARRLARQRGRLRADVGLLQSALLPTIPTTIAGAGVAAAYRPADGLAAGGDFFDAFELPGGRVGVLIGDVAGHGREVVPVTALVRYTLRAYLEGGVAPRGALQVACPALEAQLGERMVTVAAAVFDPTSGWLTYACAGHPPPLLVGVEGGQVLACSSPPVGAGARTGLRQTTVGLPPGALACFYTDGLTDVRLGPEGRLGVEGLHQALALCRAGDDPDGLLAGLARRAEDRPDDMAVCLLAPGTRGALPPATRIEELEADAPALAAGRAERFLLACGLPAEEAHEAIGRAAPIVERVGTAVFVVVADAAGATAAVHAPAGLALRVAA